MITRVLTGLLLAALLAPPVAEAQNLTANRIQLLPTTPSSCPTGRVCLIGTNLTTPYRVAFQDSGGNLLTMGDAWRLRPSSGAPGGVQGGDVWYDAGLQMAYVRLGMSNIPLVFTNTPASFGNQAANTFLAAPNGSLGLPTFRTILDADLPVLLSGHTLTSATLGGPLAAGGFTISGLAQGTASGQALHAGYTLTCGTGLQGCGDFTAGRTLSVTTELAGLAGLVVAGVALRAVLRGRERLRPRRPVRLGEAPPEVGGAMSQAEERLVGREIRLGIRRHLRQPDRRHLGRRPLGAALDHPGAVLPRPPGRGRVELDAVEDLVRHRVGDVGRRGGAMVGAADADPARARVRVGELAVRVDRKGVRCRAAGVNLVLSRQYDAVVYYARNRVAGGDVRKGPKQAPWGGAVDYDYMLWIDSDVLFRFEDFQALLAHKVDLCAGLYLMADNARYAAVERMDAALFKERGEFEFLTPEALAGKRGLVPVDYCGFGFVLARRGVFERLEYPWFRPIYVELPGGISEFTSEDVGFCLKAKEAGIQMHVDPDVVVGHEKSVVLAPARRAA